MAIDFNSLSRPKSNSAPLDPFEIFAKTPNLKDAPNDLWKGQAEALRRWHENRNREDNVILLNTGAGKSIVGILIAQSLANETAGPVVFVCSTIDLVEQTARECDRIGLSYTKRIAGEFSNDLFETGKAFCITTYQSLFVKNSTFTGDKKPAAVIFDDAHVSERTIRDSFTMTISKKDHGALYEKIVRIVKPEFEAIERGPHFDFVLDDVGRHSVTMCPPSTAFRHREEIIAAIKTTDWRKSDFFWPALRLWEHLGLCAIFISPHAIEITPPFIPTGVYDFLGKGVRRVYLSATMEYETDFVRGFGLFPKDPIIPDNDAGNGERLILLGSEFGKDFDKFQAASEILKDNKLVISCPSYPKAAEWEKFGTPPERNEFTRKLQEFRAAASGSFLLVSRIDGIDLPQDTCRVMLIDGAPSGTSLMDRYLMQSLSLNNLFSTKMAGRITQLLGRINRGRSDYSAFLICGSDLNIWLKTERNVALLPPLIRKQVILSQTVQEGMDGATPADVAGLVSQVLSRDAGWLKFYRETVDGLEVSEDALTRVKERESQLSKSAEAECRFMTRMWQGDIAGARKALLDVLDDTALADAKLAGWYSVWLGATYDMEGDVETSIAHYKKARTRLSYYLNVPRKSDFDQETENTGPKTVLQGALLAVNHHGPQALSGLAAKLSADCNVLEDVNCSSTAKEEAVRAFGERLGFSSSRPDNEVGYGPDVIWKDEIEKYAIAFELKTEKNNPAEYNKAEVGQSHNHLQWLKDNLDGFVCSGILIIGPNGICKSEASPSDDIFLVETKALVGRMRALVAKIDDARGRTNMERYEPPRDCRRPELLRGRVYDEQDDEQVCT